jgi:hypothetical protein
MNILFFDDTILGGVPDKEEEKDMKNAVAVKVSKTKNLILPTTTTNSSSSTNNRLVFLKMPKTGSIVH